MIRAPRIRSLSSTSTRTLAGIVAGAHQSLISHAL